MTSSHHGDFIPNSIPNSGVFHLAAPASQRKDVTKEQKSQVEAKWKSDSTSQPAKENVSGQKNTQDNQV